MDPEREGGRSCAVGYAAGAKESTVLRGKSRRFIPRAGLRASRCCDPSSSVAKSAQLPTLAPEELVPVRSLSRRVSRAPATSFRGLGRAFEVLIVAERQRDDKSDHWTGGDHQKPQSETAGRVLHPTHDKGTGKACEIADRVDRRDTRCDRRASEEPRRQGPEDRQRSVGAERADGQRNNLRDRV